VHIFVRTQCKVYNYRAQNLVRIIQLANILSFKHSLSCYFISRWICFQVIRSRVDSKADLFVWGIASVEKLYSGQIV
jgi:hypothetical protein